MYWKILFTSCVCILPCIFVSQTFAIGSCKIESTPIPAITQYNKSVDARLAALKSEWTKASNCGITAWWASASADRTIGTIDRAFLEVPIFDNTFLDFTYNIKLAINGESRAPVTRDGRIFNQIEQKIIGVLANMTNQCKLTDTVEKWFTSLLQENQILENIFKQTALGISVVPTWLSEPNIVIANAIIEGYSVSATESCQDQNGNQDVIEKLNKIITKTWNKNESALKNWKIAIDLFQWKWSNYTSVQKNILRAEVSRQGFSPRMAEAILKNFDCVKAETVGDDSLKATVNARIECAKNPLVRIEGFNLLPMRKVVDASKTTTERVRSVNQLSDTEKILKDITKTYYVLDHTKVVTIEDKTKLISNLIDLHLELISTAERIEKRLQPMNRNCMKAQPGISCPKP